MTLSTQRPEAGWKGSAAGSAAEMPKTSYYQALRVFLVSFPCFMLLG